MRRRRPYGTRIAAYLRQNSELFVGVDADQFQHRALVVALLQLYGHSATFVGVECVVIFDVLRQFAVFESEHAVTAGSQSVNPEDSILVGGFTTVIKLVAASLAVGHGYDGHVRARLEVVVGYYALQRGAIRVDDDFDVDGRSSGRD